MGNIRFYQGRILFDSGKTAFTSDCCCTGDLPPCCIRATVSGGGTCIGGVYVLQPKGGGVWECNAYNACCGGAFVATITIDPDTNCITVSLCDCTWEECYSPGTMPEPCDLSGESISYSSSGAGCDCSSSTVTLDAVSDDLDVCPKCGDLLTGCTALCQHDWNNRSATITLTGTLTDNGCNACDTIDGTYVLDKDCSVGADCCGAISCAWGYNSGFFCSFGGTRVFRIALYASTSGCSTNNCKLIAKVWIDTPLCSAGINEYAATYESACFSVCDPCLPAGGRTLNRVSQNFTSGECTGDYPGSILAE